MLSAICTSRVEFAAMASDNLLKQWWRQLRFDVPRLRSHPASRRRVIAALFAALVFTSVMALFFGPLGWFEYRFGGGIWALIFIGVMYIFAFLWRYAMKRRSGTVALNLSAAPAPSLHKALLAQREVAAILVARAIHELSLLNQTDLAHPQGIVRASLIQRLRSDRLWDTLPPATAALLSSPEGSFSSDQTHRIVPFIEMVAVLSWMLREDIELPSLRNVVTSYNDTLEMVLEQPDPAPTVPFLRTLTEIASKTDPANIYLRRAQGELIQRKIIPPTPENPTESPAADADPTVSPFEVGQYLSYAVSLGEADLVAEDLPLGGGLISEASSPDLAQLVNIAAVRILTLEALQEAIKGKGLGKLQSLIGDMGTQTSPS
jgi:hypothetical protein